MTEATKVSVGATATEAPGAGLVGEEKNENKEQSVTSTFDAFRIANNIDLWASSSFSKAGTQFFQAPLLEGSKKEVRAPRRSDSIEQQWSLFGSSLTREADISYKYEEKNDKPSTERAIPKTFSSPTTRPRGILRRKSDPSPVVVQPPFASPVRRTGRSSLQKVRNRDVTISPARLRRQSEAQKSKSGIHSPRERDNITHSTSERSGRRSLSRRRSHQSNEDTSQPAGHVEPRNPKSEIQRGRSNHPRSRSRSRSASTRNSRRNKPSHSPGSSLRTYLVSRSPMLELSNSKPSLQVCMSLERDDSSSDLDSYISEVPYVPCLGTEHDDNNPSTIPSSRPSNPPRTAGATPGSDETDDPGRQNFKSALNMNSLFISPISSYRNTTTTDSDLISPTSAAGFWHDSERYHCGTAKLIDERSGRHHHDIIDEHVMNIKSPRLSSNRSRRRSHSSRSAIKATDSPHEDEGRDALKSCSQRPACSRPDPSQQNLSHGRTFHHLSSRVRRHNSTRRARTKGIPHDDISLSREFHGEQSLYDKRRNNKNEAVASKIAPVETTADRNQ